jgi:hypothetical protein
MDRNLNEYLKPDIQINSVDEFNSMLKQHSHEFKKLTKEIQDINAQIEKKYPEWKTFMELSKKNRQG